MKRPLVGGVVSSGRRESGERPSEVKMTSVNQGSECDFNLSFQISSFLCQLVGRRRAALPGFATSPWSEPFPRVGTRLRLATHLLLPLPSESAQLVALQGRRPRGGRAAHVTSGSTLP